MLHTTSKRISIYKTTVSSIDHKFSMDIELNQVEKPVLLTVPNPRYSDHIEKYRHLSGVFMSDTDTKAELPIHLVLGACEYSKIKTATAPRVGRPGEPVAEMTSLGWAIMSPGKEMDLRGIVQTGCTRNERCRRGRR